MQHWDSHAVPCPAPHRSLGLSLQIDELYEAYCIQRRLRDGAHNMVKAYSTGSPGSREARESLAEASKGYKEYTEVRQLAGVGWQGAGSHGWLLKCCCLSVCAQNMCLLENELESQLGEFHVRMKGNTSCSILGLLPACLLPADAPLPSLAGLAGFARLCAGDQYEVGGTIWVGICSSPALWSLGCLGGIGGRWCGGHVAGQWWVEWVPDHAHGHTESTHHPGVVSSPSYPCLCITRSS